jgi:hypothetical protein
MPGRPVPISPQMLEQRIKQEKLQLEERLKQLQIPV